MTSFIRLLTSSIIIWNGMLVTENFRFGEQHFELLCFGLFLYFGGLFCFTLELTSLRTEAFAWRCCCACQLMIDCKKRHCAPAVISWCCVFGFTTQTPYVRLISSISGSAAFDRFHKGSEVMRLHTLIRVCMSIQTHYVLADWSLILTFTGFEAF